MRCATVYQRKQELLVHAMSKTVDGVWVLTAPCERLTVDVPDDVLGGAVRAAPGMSRADVPHPRDFRSVTEPLLRAAGVKTWSVFARGAVCVEIEEAEPGSFELIPTDNRGSAEGFVPRDGRQKVQSTKEIDIGRAVRASLSTST